MDDKLFDYPLTVKIKLNAGWGKIKAFQKGKEIAVKIIKHNNEFYALVEVVPDKGAVAITNSGGMQIQVRCSEP